jgi:hypothetical protein
MIPSKDQNQEGFHQRYRVEKIAGNTDPRAHYLVLRLDKFGGDEKWINACRKAAMTLADEVEKDFPFFAGDLRRNYSP